MPPIEPRADDAALRASLRNALQDELAQMPPDAGLAELHARLQADTAHAPAAPRATWRGALRDWFTQWPTALAGLVIVLQSGLLLWQAQTPPEAPTWRSTSVGTLGSAPTALLVVRFAAHAPLAEVTTLLHTLQAEAVAGPDEAGRWTLAVPNAQRDTALARLQASPLVDAAAAP